MTPCPGSTMKRKVNSRNSAKPVVMESKGRSFCHIAYRAGIGRLPMMPMRKGGCKIADEATISSTRFWRYHRNGFSRTSTLSPIIDIDIRCLCICYILLLQLQLWRSHLHNQSTRDRQSSHISSPIPLNKRTWQRTIASGLPDRLVHQHNAISLPYRLSLQADTKAHRITRPK